MPKAYATYQELGGPAVRNDSNVVLFNQPMVITNALGDAETTALRTLSTMAFDAEPKALIEGVTNLEITAYGQTKSGVQGFISETSPQTFDFFRINKRGDVEFYDADNNTWRKWRSMEQFNSRRGITAEREGR